MTETLKNHMNNVNIVVNTPLQLPKLKKVGENKTELPKLKLPKLKKVGEKQELPKLKLPKLNKV